MRSLTGEFWGLWKNVLSGLVIAATSNKINIKPWYSDCILSVLICIFVHDVFAACIEIAGSLQLSLLRRCFSCCFKVWGQDSTPDWCIASHLFYQVLFNHCKPCSGNDASLEVFRRWHYPGGFRLWIWRIWEWFWRILGWKSVCLRKACFACAVQAMCQLEDVS